MSLAAALVIAVTVSLGDGTNFYQPQNWQGPTMSDLETCASMARDLNDGFDYLIREGKNTDWQSKAASCEVYMVDDVKPGAAAKPVSFKF